MEGYDTNISVTGRQCDERLGAKGGFTCQGKRLCVLGGVDSALARNLLCAVRKVVRAK